MSSTSDSTKTFKIVDSDVPSGYVLRSGFDRNPYEISSLSKNMWQPTDVILVRGASPGVQPVARHKITFAYFAPEVEGIRVPALAGTTHQRTKVERTIKEWERYAHVSFVLVTDVKVAKIRILFDPDDGNWSLVGIEHEGMAGIGIVEQTMNLGKLRTVGDSPTIMNATSFSTSLDIALVSSTSTSPQREKVLSLWMRVSITT